MPSFKIVSFCHLITHQFDTDLIIFYYANTISLQQQQRFRLPNSHTHALGFQTRPKSVYLDPSQSIVSEQDILDFGFLNMLKTNKNPMQTSTTTTTSSGSNNNKKKAKSNDLIDLDTLDINKMSVFDLFDPLRNTTESEKPESDEDETENNTNTTTDEMSSSEPTPTVAEDSQPVVEINGGNNKENIQTDLGNANRLI